MNREEFIAYVDSLGFDKSEFCLLSGGALLLRGLREKTNDVDISITKEAAERINLESFPVDEKGLYVIKENVQCSGDFEKFDKELVDGYWCESLEEILKFKKSMMREKDLPDIKKIEAVLAKK